MAGGIGSRFWPVSRSEYPKQFIDILGTGKTLIQQTVERFLKLVPLENIFIVTANEYADITREQLPNLPDTNIVCEPCRKNTAPCIAYISHKLAIDDPEASLIVAPSDHLILDEEQFLDTCRKAIQFAESNDCLITLGIRPSHPNTGYGYIKHESESSAPGIYPVDRFTEKPSISAAIEFLQQGNYLWNSGIFIWKLASIVKSFQEHMPEMNSLFEGIKEHLGNTIEAELLANIYDKCESISIDYGVLERAKNVFVIPSSFGWSDLGTWNSAWENMDKDHKANAVAGDKVLLLESSSCVVHAPDEKVVVLQGLEDYIVVDTHNVLLVCKKDREQDIKQYVSAVKNQHGLQFV